MVSIGASAKRYLFAATAFTAFGVGHGAAMAQGPGFPGSNDPMIFETVTITSERIAGRVDDINFAAPMSMHPNAGVENYLDGGLSPLPPMTPESFYENEKLPSLVSAAPTVQEEVKINNQPSVQAGQQTAAQTAAMVAPALISPSTDGVGIQNPIRRMIADTDLLPEVPTDPAEIATRNNKFIQMVASAVEANPALIGASNSVLVGGEVVNEARAALYPQVGIRLSGGRSISEPTGSYGSDSHGRTDLVLTARQLVFDFGTTFGRIDSAKFEENATRYESLNSANEMALDTISAYLSVISLREQVRLSQKNVAKHQEIAKMVIERINAKVAPQSDIDQINSRIATARAQLSSLTGEFDRAQAVFMEKFAEKPGDIKFPVLDIALLPENKETLGANIVQNPQMKMHEMRVQAAKSLSDAESNSSLPKLVLEADATRYDIDPTSGPTTTSPGSKPYGAVARLNIVYDLFDGGAAKARAKKALYRAAKAGDDRDAFARELARMTSYAYANVKAKKSLIKALELSIKAGQGTVDAYTQKYQIGRLSLVDLLDAQSDLFKSAIDMSKERSLELLSQFSVMMLTGGMLEYFNINTDKFQEAAVEKTSLF